MNTIHTGGIPRRAEAGSRPSARHDDPRGPDRDGRRALRLSSGLLAALAGLLALAGPGTAQEEGEGWNTPRVLGMVAGARHVRQAMVVDSALLSYSAEATGFLYFFLDREDTEEHTLIKADQLALRIYWAAPDQTRQRIVGRRDERQLPTTIRYHLDHLTVVQDDFSDRIRLGDGDEVSSVLHPLAPGADAVYDFRLADSVTLSFPGGVDPVRVYEVRVRPRVADAPGFLGSVFLDRSTSAVVRMSFTFTPASYVDPYLDYIRISLDNARWMNRYWLPYRQQVEIRRELPQLDLPAGSIIRGEYRIGGYEFNPDLPQGFFRGPRVTSLPSGVQERFDFDEGLYAQLDRDGLQPTPELEEIRRMAAGMAADRYLSGLGRFRLHLPAASQGLRYNRAEGAFVGVGLSLTPTGSLRIRPGLGYAFGRERPAARLGMAVGSPAAETGLRGAWNEVLDVGPLPGSSGAMNTLATALVDSDYLDPYFSSGVTLFHHRRGAGGSVRLEASWSRQRSGSLVLGDGGGSPDLRPVRPVTEGEGWALRAGLTRKLGPRGLEAGIDVTAATFEGEAYGELRGRLGWERSWLTHALTLRGELHGGAVSSRAPLQELYLLGGRETLPGYDYRSLAGDAFWLFRVEAAREVAHPWVTARVFGSAGRTFLLDRPLPPSWDAREPSIALWSAGAGVGLLWDVLHLDAARGLNGGEWAIFLSVSHRFWPWL